MCDIFGFEEVLDRLRGKLSAERGREFREHLPSCASCRAAVEELPPGREALDGLRKTLPGSNLPSSKTFFVTVMKPRNSAC